MVFAMSGQTEGSGECEPAPSIGRSRLSPRIHLSAIIAFACYAVGAAICVLASPATLADLLAGGTGPYVQLFAMAAFIVVVAPLQRHISGSMCWLSRRSCFATKSVYFEASSARRSKPIAAARRVGFSFRLAASAGTGSVVEALEEQGVHKLLRILQPLTGGNHETGSTRDLSYRARTWRLPPGITGISADEARIDSSAFCSAIMSLS